MKANQVHPLAGQLAPPDQLIDVPALERAYHERPTRSGRPAPARRLRHQRPPGHAARRHLHRGAHPGDHPGDLRLPPRPGDRRPALPGQGHARPVRPGAADGARGAGRQRRRDDPPARRRRDADAGHLARHPRLQPRPRRAPAATASSSRRRTTRPPTAASSTTRPTAARPTPTSPRWIQDRANALLRVGQRRGQARAVRPGDPRRHDPRRSISSRPTSTTWRASSTWTRSAPRASSWASTRSAARPSTTGSRSPTRYGLDITVTNPAVDPTFRFMTLDHDGKIRMDCSSPYAMASLVKLKDRFDVAFGNDPDSDRHGIVTPSVGPDEPQPLPGRRDPLPAHPSRRTGPRRAAVGKTLVSSSLIDRVVAGPGPDARRGAGRLQVVRAGPARRLVLLRRRGERRRQLPAARRHRLDDRQGRPDPGPAGRGDPRPDRQGSRASTTAS